MAETADLTELQLVNQMLRKAGVQTVTALDSTNPPDVVAAKDTLDDIRRSISEMGWWWNTEVEVELTPDAATGEIALPADYISVDASLTKGACLDVVKRGLKLYYREKRTFDFTSQGVSSVFLSATILLPLTDIPQTFRSWIVARALREWSWAQYADQALDQRFRADEDEAESKARAEAWDNADVTLFDAPTDANRARTRGSWYS